MIDPLCELLSGADLSVIAPFHVMGKRNSEVVAALGEWEIGGCNSVNDDSMSSVFEPCRPENPVYGSLV
jgi:hypothetical protein